MQYGDECWRNNGCPSKPPAAPEPQKPAPAAEMPEGWSVKDNSAHEGADHWETDAHFSNDLLSVAYTQYTDTPGEDHCMGGAVPLFVLRALLATQGLHVVSEAEAACAKHGLSWLQSSNQIDLGKNEGMMVLALRRYEAELARRGKP
jgi:hypothetical protein